MRSYRQIVHLIVQYKKGDDNNDRHELLQCTKKL